MSKNRYSARVDSNQGEIVKALRAINGATVQLNMDDILIGYKGVNYWIEIKEPNCVSKKTGEINPSKIKESQHKLVAEWRGQYDIVSSIDEILAIMGVTHLQ